MSWWWEIRCWETQGTVAGKGNVIYYLWSERLGGAGQLPLGKAGQEEGLSFSLRFWHGFIFTPLPKWCWTSSPGAGGVGGERVGKAPMCEVARWDGRVVMRGWNRQQSFSCLLLLLHFWPFFFVVFYFGLAWFYILLDYLWVFCDRDCLAFCASKYNGDKALGLLWMCHGGCYTKMFRKQNRFFERLEKNTHKKAVEELTKSNLGN